MLEVRKQIPSESALVPPWNPNLPIGEGVTLAMGVDGAIPREP
jgi:hypothetical protein